MLTEGPAAQFTDLKECLDDFQQRFNTNERVRKLVKNWDRQVMVEATDTGAIYTMYVEDAEMRRIEEGRSEGDDEYLVHLQATNETLMEIFSGNYNPSTALLDGMLSVFSNERDKVKLEACAMVIWGL
ncbi:MAG: SCP2 sterol-binding domain-containing protein [Thermoleophilia bacterium]|nr:SCP2 sterol-binding domain-containing protein [Thermoleophilia bacterium]